MEYYSVCTLGRLFRLRERVGGRSTSRLRSAPAVDIPICISRVAKHFDIIWYEFFSRVFFWNNTGMNELEFYKRAWLFCDT